MGACKTPQFSCNSSTVRQELWLSVAERDLHLKPDDTGAVPVEKAFKELMHKSLDASASPVFEGSGKDPAPGAQEGQGAASQSFPSTRH